MVGKSLLIALRGSLAIAVVGSPTLAWADGVDCDTQKNQKSVVIKAGEALDRIAKAEKTQLQTTTAEGTEAALQPIANVSDYEPDLADEPVQATAVASDSPVAEPNEVEEVTIDDTASANESNEEVAIESGEPQPSSFFGATPGTTTRVQLVEEWGSPVDDDTTSDVLAYELKGFPRVTVRLQDDVVVKIQVQLAEPFVANSLMERLQLNEFDSYTRTNELGDVTETVIPERGVTLSHELATDGTSINADGEHLVHGLAIQTLSGSQFLQRAQQRPARDFDARIADLETALTYDGNLTVAKYELSRIGLELGRPVLASELIEEALESDTQSPESNSPEFKLQRARCLTATAKYRDAVATCQEILESTDTSKLIRAQTLHQMGLLSSLGSKTIAKQTVPLHNKAIELADQLATSPDAGTATAAGELLVDAHLAIAKAIAAGEWQDQEKTVAQWITRASGLAEEQIERSATNLPLRLQVTVNALAAGAKLNPPIDPKLWVAEAEDTAAKLNALSGDVTAAAQTQWQLGLAYYYATDIQHRRGKSASALRYGDLAQSQLVELAETRSECPDTDFLIGRTYFQIGAVHAVHRGDHETACEYYDNAGPLLMNSAPVTPLASPGRHGDALVSMGVSYWNVGQRDLAYEYTENGVDLVTQGISEGLLTADAAAVAQGNLAAMDRALGKVRAEDFEPITPTAPQREAQTQIARKTNSRTRTNSSRTTSNGNSSQQRVARRNSQRR
ncbi:tetratricopeptide repeat protein [Adhaeretor mobilis]|uniref:Tetratricopeptide repeat protein n=1 Tax=Adhaeretor mobilis TaxID=1930276 RepID=A0A517N333_9BACT|nr:hypothetical protein [Adhaeretor mobilis]QDT01398.1 hypothetical protein HG15A2_47400 [Adhaeretor mobilis]